MATLILKDTYLELEEEIKSINKLRAKTALQIEEAASHGDLKENYEYKAAKEKMEFVVYKKQLLQSYAPFKFIEYGENITSKDPLNFKMPDKSYAEQIDSYQKRTNKKSAVTILKGKINNREIVLGVMDFSFIGGSMGTVVGHKLGMAIDLADKEKLPLLFITSSGGASCLLYTSPSPRDRG